ncbi:MAG: phosphatase PAP2 family protein [Chloroflexi bacterium]|nr:phosphatase PAP2 family protein [Chloroflexota bacterium]
MLENLLAASLEFTHWVQSWAGPYAAFFRFFTFLGKADFYILIMPALIWLYDYRLGIRMGVVLLLNGWVNDVFKLLFAAPRPYWADPAVQTYGEAETTFGIPSGHAQLPASIYGLFAVTLRRRWATVAAALLVFLIGFSRVALGLHYALDVLAGWALGLALLAVILKYEAPVIRWLGGMSRARRLALIFAFTLAAALASAALRPELRGFALPAEWAANAAAAHPEEAINPSTLEDTLTYVGALFGLALGVDWLAGRGGYDPRGKPFPMLARFVLGALGALLIWRGLGAVFPGGENLLAYALRYLRYALLGFWIAAGAPWLFMRLGLAKSA